MEVLKLVILDEGGIGLGSKVKLFIQGVTECVHAMQAQRKP